jgi:citrate lyase subunit beta/citryl-CoA lyase
VASSVISSLPRKRQTNGYEADSSTAKPFDVELVMTTELVTGARSFLFVPGDDPRKLASANRSDADAIVADLEDAVAPARKDAARDVVNDFARARGDGPPLLVRVNALSSAFVEQDIEALRELPLAGLVVPKTHADDLVQLDLSRFPIVALIEDARGILDAFDIACDVRVVRLALGAVDLAAELGLRPYGDGLQLLHARSHLVIASSAAGIAAPIDTPFLRFDDEEGLRSECELARALGFAGKSCIHPVQLETVADVFAPSPEELTWAAEVVEVFERAAGSGLGVTSHRGAMVDAPVVRRARLLLAKATERRERQ